MIAIDDGRHMLLMVQQNGLRRSGAEHQLHAFDHRGAPAKALHQVNQSSTFHETSSAVCARLQNQPPFHKLIACLARDRCRCA